LLVKKEPGRVEKGTMAYGFLDEAGDLGSGPRSSSALVVVVIVTGDPQSLRREVKKVRTRLGKKNGRSQSSKRASLTPRGIGNG